MVAIYCIDYSLIDKTFSKRSFFKCFRIYNFYRWKNNFINGIYIGINDLFEIFCKISSASAKIIHFPLAYLNPMFRAYPVPFSSFLLYRFRCFYSCSLKCDGVKLIISGSLLSITTMTCMSSLTRILCKHLSSNRRTFLWGIIMEKINRHY